MTSPTRRLVLCLVALAALGGCGQESRALPPHIDAFAASPPDILVGDTVELLPEFTGTEARIEPEVGAVLDGGRYRVGPFASGRLYTLVVRHGDREVRRDLQLSLRYRHRLTNITPSGIARVDHGAAVLPDGRVLVFGGRSPTHTPWVRTELFDPATGAFTETGEMPLTRTSPVWAGVSGARVVVAGGETSSARRDEATAVLVWDPASGDWTSPGRLREFRFGNTATRLPVEGNVLLVAGGDFYLQSPERVSPVELFDVDTGESRLPAGKVVAARLMHTATRLFDGRVLLAGGLDAFTNLEVGSAELYDPATETFSRACTLAAERWAHGAASLPDGRVLLAGGYALGGVTDTAELWDPTTGECQATGSLFVPRADLRLVVLATGEVLAVGGRDDAGQALAAVESWDPLTGVWSHRPSLPGNRVGHSVSVLHDGRVLILGGAGGSGAFPVQAAELYD